MNSTSMAGFFSKKQYAAMALNEWKCMSMTIISASLIKKLAEFICQTENFSNFILGENSDKRLYIILLATQIHNFFRYSHNFQRVNFYEN